MRVNEYLPTQLTRLAAASYERWFPIPPTHSGWLTRMCLRGRTQCRSRTLFFSVQTCANTQKLISACEWFMRLHVLSSGLPCFAGTLYHRVRWTENKSKRGGSLFTLQSKLDGIQIPVMYLRNYTEALIVQFYTILIAAKCSSRIS